MGEALADLDGVTALGPYWVMGLRDKDRSSYQPWCTVSDQMERKGSLMSQERYVSYTCDLSFGKLL